MNRMVRNDLGVRPTSRGMTASHTLAVALLLVSLAALAAAVAALAAGGLTWIAERSLPKTILYAGATFGGVLTLTLLVLGFVHSVVR
jgi:hypothetical protein